MNGHNGSPERYQGRADETCHGARWLFAKAPEKRISVNGVDIQYRSWTRAVKDARTILFLHGYRAHSRWWDHIVPFFWNDHRIATMDFGGFGDSGWRGHYTLRQFAEEILAILDVTGFRSSVVVAHSFAGSPAALASTMDPSAFDRLILVDSRMLLEGIAEPQALPFETPGPRQRCYPSREALLERFRLVPPVSAVADTLFEHIRAHSGRPTPDGWTWKFDPALDPRLPEDPHRHVPPGCTTPIDYIYGENSSVVDADMAHRIAAILGSCSEPVAIPQCDHHILLERPLTLASVVRALLARHGHGGGP